MRNGAASGTRRKARGIGYTGRRPRNGPVRQRATGTGRKDPRVSVRYKIVPCPQTRRLAGAPSTRSSVTKLNG